MPDKHLNRDIRDTPFISTSNRLFWSIRNALVKLRDGNDVAFTVIDRQVIPATNVFHARPYRDAILHRAEFDNGAHRYGATYEFLCWRSIPERAIVHTVTISDLARTIRDDPEMSQVFRLDTLASKRAVFHIGRDFKFDKLPLTVSVVSAMAKLAILLGVGVCPIRLTHIVRDIVEGWQIHITFQPPKMWSAFANQFLHAVGRTEALPLATKDQERVKLAFLEGVRLGMAKPNAAHTEIAQLERKWHACGLLKPDTILAFEGDQRAMAQRLLAMDIKARDVQLRRHHSLVTPPRIQTIPNQPFVPKVSDDNDWVDDVVM
jgi:hypothetical protein